MLFNDIHTTDMSTTGMGIMPPPGYSRRIAIQQEFPE
jgi:hypothetical protein